MYWYEEAGHQRDVFLSSRVRLARNIVDYPFAVALDKTGAKEILERVKNALCPHDGYKFIDFSALAEKDKLSLVEKNVASPDMLEKTENSAIVENTEKGVFVLVGEEDHIRIQALCSGFDLESCAKRAFEAEALIDAKEKIAFSKELGYLTHCPTNLGTGMRASVMMFLPMLSEKGEMGAIEAYLSKIGLMVRGADGEGSKARGNLYQISNRLTLGITEEETVKRLSEAVSVVANRERELREAAKGRDVALEDRIMRSLGIMRYARRVDTKELYRLFSDVRLGIAMGYIDDRTFEDIDKLRVDSMRGALCCRAGRLLSESERDAARAELLRTF